MEYASEDGCEARELPAPPVPAARFPALTQGTDEPPILRFPQQILLPLPHHRVVYVPAIHPVASLASGSQPLVPRRFISPRSGRSEGSLGVLANHNRCTGRSGGEVSPKGWIGGWRSFARTVRGVLAYGTWLEEIHLSSAGYRLGAAARPQLAVEAVDVRLDGARRDIELGCDLLVGLARGDEREHLQLPLARRLGEPLVRGRHRGPRREGRQELREVARRDAVRGVEAASFAGFQRRREELAHRGSLVHEGANVAFRFCQSEGSRQGAHGPLFLLPGPQCHRLQD